MYGHYRNTGIPRLHTYADALARFNNTKPIRGRTDISKPMYPLGYRNKVDSFWMQLCPFTQDVVCYLYRTPVVTFKANGEVHIKSEGWDSISTSNFISEVLGGVSAYIYDHSLCVHIWNENGSEQYRVPNEGTLVLRKEGRWQYVSGAPNNVIHRVNRKAINGLRKGYKDFKQYAIAMIKLRGGMFGREEFTDAFGEGSNYLGDKTITINPYSWSYDGFMRGVSALRTFMSDEGEDKHQSFYRGLLLLVNGFGSYHNLNLTEFERGFNLMTLGIHRDEALTEEVLPIGVVKRDNYGRYWRRGWSKYHVHKAEAFALGEKHDEDNTNN